MPRHVAMAVLGLLGLVFAMSAGFSWLSVHLRLPLVQEWMQSQQQMKDQQSQQVVQNNLQLMATRLGELQAQVLQLDSLSDRLSTLAGIKREAAQAAPATPDKTPGRGGPLIAAPLSAADLQKEIERLARDVDSKADELTMLESRLLEKRVRDRLLPTTLPVKEARIGSGFGYRSDPIEGVRAMHEGIDFEADTGTPVVAAAAGVVVTSEYHPDFGNMIDIDHGDGLVSRYAHLSKSLVKAGQIVHRGDRIGAVGSTGRSTGSHLHFEVRMLGVAQNPAYFLKQGEEYALAKHR